MIRDSEKEAQARCTEGQVDSRGSKDLDKRSWLAHACCTEITKII